MDLDSKIFQIIDVNEDNLEFNSNIFVNIEK